MGRQAQGGLGGEGASAEAGGGERGWRSLFVGDSTGPLFWFFIKQKKKKRKVKNMKFYTNFYSSFPQVP